MSEATALFTRNRHNMFEVSSMVQKCLRRNLLYEATYAAKEMSEKFRPYLWRRLLTVSGEDCYYNTTKYVMDMYKKDKTAVDGDYSAIEMAVGFLSNAEKSRDADYFACNLMNSKFKVDLTSIEPTLTDVGSRQYPTKNGHSMFDAAAAMCYFIERQDFKMAGYCCNEVYWRYPNYFWTTIINECKKLNFPLEFIDEIIAIKEADRLLAKTKVTTVLVSKAMVMIIRFLKYGEDAFKHSTNFTYYRFDQIEGRLEIPDYVFDCHTHRGKLKGRTKEEFVVQEQTALTPFHAGEFDNASWEAYFSFEKEGFIDEASVVPWPSKKTIKAEEQGQIELNLFD